MCSEGLSRITSSPTASTAAIYFLVRRYNLTGPPREAAAPIIAQNADALVGDTSRDRDRIVRRTINRVIWLDKGRQLADSMDVHTMMLGYMSEGTAQVQSSLRALSDRF
jgi:hypothetical protein